MVEKFKQRLKNQRGFTLVELLAVIVILGIIAAIAVPSIGNIIAKSKFDAAKSEAIQAIEATRLYVASEAPPSTKTTFELSDLGDYLDTPSYWSAFTVTYTASDKTYSFSGTAVESKFTNNPTITGTKNQIEALKYSKSAKTE